MTEAFRDGPTDPSIPRIPDFELYLPAQAPPMPGDEPSVGLLADDGVRRGLQEANDAITGRLRESEAAEAVHVLFRGVVGRMGVCVAERVTAQAAAGIDPEHYRSQSAIFPGSAVYDVFAYRLDGLTSDGAAAAAARPWQLVDVPQTRGWTLGLRAPGGRVVELAMPTLYKGPSIDDAPVVSFERAAFGERRHTAADKSLDWLYMAVRQAGRSGDTAGAEKIREYRGQRLAELYQHPEWIDTPVSVEEILPGLEAYLAERQSAWDEVFMPRRPTVGGLLSQAAQHIREERILHPDELFALRGVMMPDTIDARVNAYGSYYRSGAAVEGPRGAVARALHEHRQKTLAEVLA